MLTKKVYSTFLRLEKVLYNKCFKRHKGQGKASDDMACSTNLLYKPGLQKAGDKDKPTYLYKLKIISSQSAG